MGGSMPQLSACGTDPCVAKIQIQISAYRSESLLIIDGLNLLYDD